MLWKRLIYAAACALAAAAFIATDSGAALFACVCLLAVPAVSLLMLAIAKRLIKFDFSVRESCIRGGALDITMRAGLSPRFLAGAVKVTVDVENTTFRKSERRVFVFKDLSFAPHSYDFVGADSGRINVRFVNITLFDVFGICSLKIKCSRFAESIVSPVLYDGLRITLGANGSASLTGENSLPRRGGDRSEIFNVRDYVAGDSLHSVHWKLSGKFDTLKSKEYGANDENRTLILADLSRKKTFGEASDEQLNCVLDAVVSISASLKDGGEPHCIGWFNGGEYNRAEVFDGDSFVKAVYSLMSIKVAEGNSETLFYASRTKQCSIFTTIIFVAPSVTATELRQFPSADITALAVGERDGELDEGGIKIIDVPCALIEKSLACRVL